MKLAIIGAGNVGSALGERLAAEGNEIVFGVRPGRSVEELLARCGGRASAASPAEAVAGAEIVFLAVPAESAVEALAGIDVDGKIVVDCNNPVGWGDGPVLEPPAEGSVTAQLAACYPEARWVKGFATFGTELHRNPDLGAERAQVHLAGDDAEAKSRVADLARSAGFDPVDCGPLRNAAHLEGLAILWIHLAMTGDHGREFAFQIVPRREG